MKIKLLIIVTYLVLAQNSFAREFQLGVVLGSPTGISMKSEIDNKHSVDAALAYSLVEDRGLEFHADYLVEKAHEFSTNTGIPFDVFYGIGGRIASIRKGKHVNDLAIGPRAPIGLAYKMNDPRIEFFGELALVLDVIPETNLDLEGGIGLRYRF